MSDELRLSRLNTVYHPPDPFVRRGDWTEGVSLTVTTETQPWVAVDDEGCDVPRSGTLGKTEVIGGFLRVNKVE